MTDHLVVDMLLVKDLVLEVLGNPTELEDFFFNIERRVAIKAVRLVTLLFISRLVDILRDIPVDPYKPIKRLGFLNNEHLLDSPAEMLRLNID